MGILGLWHLACPDAAPGMPQKSSYAVTAAPEQEETNTQFVEEQHTLELLLGLVSYQRRANKFKTDLAAFMKTVFSLLRSLVIC